MEPMKDGNGTGGSMAIRCGGSSEDALRRWKDAADVTTATTATTASSHSQPTRFDGLVSAVKSSLTAIKSTGASLMAASTGKMNGIQDLERKPSTASANQRRPIRLKNWSVQTEIYDTLHSASLPEGACGVRMCTGSLWHANPFRLTQHLPEERQQLLASAKEFLEQYYASVKRQDTTSFRTRWEAVQKEILMTGTYDLTETELTFGAKLGWRNSARCIGRIQWTKLQVFDARHVTTAQGMFEALCNHIKYGTNRGNIRSAATIFSHRKPGQGDFRIWNAQLIGYAGYRNEDGTITGDPINVEFTEVCQKLGWTSNTRTEFDVLPLVLQANGRMPEVFEIPPELILELTLQHPTYDWFSSLGLKWYALPAVSGMALDCGGLQFTCLAFNGWYMTTEIGTRDLADVHRYNKTEVVAKKMGLDTRSHSSLWKDRACVELNAAVLYTFQKQNVTIVDHHTAAESFMKHMETEMRLRGGCPADWVWIVPPTSGSLTPVFHQEMATYALKPSYEYQEAAWKSFKWDQEMSSGSGLLGRKKYRFKEVARVVKFTSNLFGKALSRRIKATILFASETGKSEKFAYTLAELFNHAFNAQVMCMANYDVINLEHEALVLIVTSTFGNGDPPENGESFAREVYNMRVNHSLFDDVPANFNASKHSFGRTLVKRSDSITGDQRSANGLLVRDRSLRSFSSDNDRISSIDDTLGLLSNVRFAVFALGSSAYPYFCAFGKYIDNLIGDLGGERLVQVTTGDELSGQEQAFKVWAQKVFHVACETFCLEDDVNIDDASATLRNDSITADTVRFVTAPMARDLIAGLSSTHGRKVFDCRVGSNLVLASDEEDRKSIHVSLKIGDDWRDKIRYDPGDHVGIFATNEQQMVDDLIERLTNRPAARTPLQLQILTDSQDGGKVWQNQQRLPVSSLRTLLSRYLDITTPPSQTLLALLGAHADNPEDKARLQLLATDYKEYEDWKHWKYPHLLETLQEFPSVKLDAALIVSQLPLLKPRFYSIANSPLVDPNQIDLTVAVVSYRTQAGEGPIHYGVCSNYLSRLNVADSVYCFVRSTPNFHLPVHKERPVVMVGPGTGVAPFRGFWQHKHAQQLKGQSMGPMVLFTGYRTPEWDLYAEEKRRMLEAGTLDCTFLALSRQPGLVKTYVQDKLLEAAPLVYRILSQQGGHFYVCGDCAMAEDVAKTLRLVMQQAGDLTEEESESYLMRLRDERRYQEDIFGITYRIPEAYKRNK